MKKIILPLFFCILNSVSSFLFSQSGGNHTYEFLNLAIPSRVSALGGTLISVKDNDLNLSFQNPSLLDSTMHKNLSLSYIDYFTDIQYGYAAYSHTFRKIGSFSAGIQFLDYGTFTSANKEGEITGQFSAGEYALNLGYSRQIDSMFAVGGTLKTIYSKLSDYTSFGNAVDVGGIYNNRKRLFSAGLVIKNLGKQWKTYQVAHEPLPFEVELGLSKKISHAPFRVNFSFTHLEKWDLTFVDPSIPTVDPITGASITQSKLSKFSDKLARHVVFGGEILISKNFHLRVGYNYLRRKELLLGTRPGIIGFSFGFGVKVSKFHLSYAYSKYHMAGGPNNFTISTAFSDFSSKKK